MAGEWSTGRLADVAAGIQTGPFGSQLHASDYVPSGVPVVMPTNIRDRRIDTEGISFIGDDDADRLSRHKLRLHDLVFSRRGEVDKCALVTKDTVGWLCGTGCLLVRPDEKKCDPAFLSFHISAPDTREWLKQHAVGLVMPNLNTEILSSIPLNLPPLGEQRRIAVLLSSLDDKIELNRRMAATLEEMARALFKSWFVDFDPVRAKAEGRDPGLPAATAALFPDRFSDDGLPVGWGEKSLLDQATWVNGAAYKDMHFSDAPDALPVVKIAELKNGLSEGTKWTNTDLGDRYRIRDGEMLFSWSGSPDTSIDTFLWVHGDAWLNQHVFAVRPNGEASEAHLFAMLKFLKPTLIEIARDKQTTGLGHVTRQDMIRLKVCVAQPRVRAAFDNIAEPLFDRLKLVLRENARLAVTRDTLLPKLISGELRIKDMGKDVEAA